MAKLISKGGTSLVDDEEITATPKKKKNSAKLIELFFIHTLTINQIHKTLDYSV